MEPLSAMVPVVVELVRIEARRAQELFAAVVRALV